MKKVLRIVNNILTWTLYLRSNLNCRMSFLKDKAEFNKSSAELLYNNCYYAPSIHCAYYSCFQLLKYLIKERLNIDYAQQEFEIGSDNRINSHSYIHKKILDAVCIREIDKDKFRDIRTKLKDLQQLRIISDYKNVLIDETKSRRALLYSNELKSYFKNKLQ